MQRLFPLIIGLSLCIGAASAQDRSEYNRRAIERYQTLFKALDLDSDQAVTLQEARGNLNFTPVFQDMDINRDGVVTAEELRRYLTLNFGLQ